MIGVFGGTFDPIHFGHLRVALELKETLGLDEMRLIPCATPPHRPQPMASVQMRLAMLELAMTNRAGLTVDPRELMRPGASYMIDTLASLKQDFPKQPLLLCIGYDAFNGLPTWHRWQQLFDYAHIVVMSRPGYHYPALAEFFTARLTTEIGQLHQQTAGKLFFQPVTQLDISATTIRQLVKQNRNPSFLLPDAVIEYIQQNRLYQA